MATTTIGSNKQLVRMVEEIDNEVKALAERKIKTIKDFQDACPHCHRLIVVPEYEHAGDIDMGGRSLRVTCEDCGKVIPYESTQLAKIVSQDELLHNILKATEEAAEERKQWRWNQKYKEAIKFEFIHTNEREAFDRWVQKVEDYSYGTVRIQARKSKKHEVDEDITMASPLTNYSTDYSAYIVEFSELTDLQKMEIIAEVSR